MTLTAMRPDSGRSNGREMSLWSVAQASGSDLGLQGGLEGLVRVVGAEEVGVAHEEALLVVVGVDEPAGNAVGAVAARSEPVIGGREDQGCAFPARASTPSSGGRPLRRSGTTPGPRPGRARRRTRRSARSVLCRGRAASGFEGRRASLRRVPSMDDLRSVAGHVPPDGARSAWSAHPWNAPGHGLSSKKRRLFRPLSCGSKSSERRGLDSANVW